MPNWNCCEITYEPDPRLIKFVSDAWANLSDESLVTISSISTTNRYFRELKLGR